MQRPGEEAEMESNIERAAKMLIEKKLTLAFAESATVGRLSAEFCMPKDAGKYFKGAFVCYDACLKEDILKVDKKLIEEFTPESGEVSRAIAFGLKNLIEADIHIGVTGLTGPGGSETTEKPVGTMFTCAVKGGEILFQDRYVFSGSPEEIILGAVDRIAALLIKTANHQIHMI